MRRSMTATRAGANARLARQQHGGGEPDGPGAHHGHVVVDVHSSGRPRARRGMRPAKPQLTRDSARLAAGLMSNSSRPKLRTSRDAGRVAAEELHEAVGEARDAAAVLGAPGGELA